MDLKVNLTHPIHKYYIHVMDMLFSLTLIFSQCILISKQVAYFTYIQYLYLDYISSNDVL